MLERDPSSRLPAGVDVYERAVSLSGMSKVYNMPGTRIGWLAVKDVSLMQGLQRLHDYSSICNAAPSEVRRQYQLSSLVPSAQRTGTADQLRSTR